MPFYKYLLPYSWCTTQFGNPTKKDTKNVNLTQLRWNTRSKGQKKCGRKKPRPGIDENSAFFNLDFR